MSESSDPLLAPIAPDIISEHPDILHSFQADLSFRKIYASSAKAERALAHMSTAIDWASSLTRKAGLSAADGITASSSKKKLILLPLRPEGDPNAKPRIFGVITTPEVSSKKIEAFLTTLH